MGSDKYETNGKLKAEKEPAYLKKFQRISLGCLTTKHPIRRLCIKIVTWKWFDRLIVSCVIFNTVILALTDYTHAWEDGPNGTIWINGFIDKCNTISFYIFLIEALLKIIAMGFCFGKNAYMSEGWNRLDFIIVTSGLLSIMNIKGVKVGFIRVLRVMRPLRTLHSLPGLKILTNCLLASLPALANVFVLLMFCMLVFGILGMEIYRGSYHFRCRITPYPVALPPNGTYNYPPDPSYIAMVRANPELFPCRLPDGTQIDQDHAVWDTPQDCFWPIDDSEVIPQVCNEQKDIGRQCIVPGTICGSNFDNRGNPRFNYLLLPPWNGNANDDALFNSNLNYGLPSFDNLGRAWLILLQTITASGWMVLTQTTQATASPVVGAIYFTGLLYIGMCFLLQLNMAVLFTEFEKAKDHQARLLEKERERQSRMLSNMPVVPRKRSFELTGSSMIKRMSAIASGHGDVIVQSAMARRYQALQQCISKIVASKIFANSGLVITVANILVLASDYHDIRAEIKTGYEIANFTFMIYFGVESALKIIGLGLKPFWMDKFNRFDLITFLMGVVEAAISPPAFIDGTPGGGGFFTAFRAARAFKIARMWKSLNQLLSAIISSMGEILNFLLFLLLFMLIFSLVGMELFATKYQFDPDNFYMPFNNSNPQTRLHRSNFDSIVWAAFTVFQILTYDNFPAVMYDGWISVGAWSPFYCSLVIILGVFVVMNMFSAILVQSVMDGNDEDNEDDDMDDQDIIPMSHGKSRSGTVTMRAKSLRVAQRAMRLLLRLNIPEPGDDIPTIDDPPPNNGKSLMIFSPSNPIRQTCNFILHRREYTWILSFIIFVSCVGTAFDSPLLDPSSGIGQVLDKSNLVFAVIFSTEMAINVIARGLIFGSDAYIKDSWRLLDGFIVFVSVLPYFWSTSKSGALTGLRSLRAFRALRPLRVINNIPSLKVVVNTLFRCIPDMGRALLFAFFMLFLFGLMALSLFKGATYSCSISPYNYGLGTGNPANPPWFPSDYTGDYNVIDISTLQALDVMTFPIPWSNMTSAQRDPFLPVWNQSGCGPFADDYTPTSRDICLCFANQNGTTWLPQAPQRFDNIFYAIAGLFELTTMEGWTSTCLAAIDAVGENMQPITNHNPLVILFWWIYMIICAFFITNLFIGVLCDSFTRETYGSMMTDEQIQWVKLQNKVLALSPLRVFPCPKHPIRAFSYRIATFMYFEHFITLVILVNTTCMAVQVFGQSQATETALSTMNTVFSVIFTLEAAVKLIAFGKVYFEDSWNRFDFVIVVFTLTSFILAAMNVNVGSAATVIRVFRVGRALRLIKKAKIMKNLFDTLIVSLPAVMNVVSLLSLLYYIFAAVAVQLFAKTAFNDDMINENQNFRNFWMAFQTLIGFSTGENWDNFTWEVYNQVPATNPTCEDRPFNASMCGYNNSYGCIPLDGCGNSLILPFMYLFFLIMGYIGINLFSGIVVDAIGDSSSDCPVNVNTLTEFSDRWAKFDPSGSGLITAEELTDFLYTVYPPFGFKGVPGFTRRRVVIAIGDLGIPIYDKQYVHFKDVPRALVQRVLAEGNREKHAEITRVMEEKGINKQFDEMWFRTHGKKHQNVLENRKTTPVREYSATLIIQRFLARVRLERERKTNLSRRQSASLIGNQRDLQVESMEVNGDDAHNHHRQ
ncbi:hypothetical protein Ae201684P_003319 [Aphanomyces euteiches]|uniref:EF-hand domain-containing protein n=1 Tax=Aphanomyces euteiches TaxID=100861 RepID=A0A6G0WAA3_9STRA|nr:hypothetical protein Ae201684_016955 [Aphanomyces euteiches]KAH9073817.1 hypothetical protein Ae201684P_003319 [Aphanomyces euteiches]KAH9134273.1 hypothetical protein AeRB84_019903 [Aphanomyces euteiches]